MASKKAAKPAPVESEAGIPSTAEVKAALTPQPQVADAVAQQLHDAVVAQAGGDAPATEAPADTGEVVNEEHEAFGTPEHAQAFLVGNLMEAAKSCFTTLPEVWSKTSQKEQEAVLKRLHDRCLEAAKGALQVYRDHARQSFPITLGKVVFNGRKVTGDFELANTPEAHTLADYSNQQVTVVIENTNKLFSVPAKLLEGEPDNKPLFDEGK